VLVSGWQTDLPIRALSPDLAQRLEEIVARERASPDARQRATGRGEREADLVPNSGHVVADDNPAWVAERPTDFFRAEG
jgi:hypothetical protein